MIIEILSIIGQLVLGLISLVVAVAAIYEGLHSHNRYDFSTPHFHIHQVPQIPPELLNLNRPLKFSPLESILN